MYSKYKEFYLYGKESFDLTLINCMTNISRKTYVTPTTIILLESSLIESYTKNNYCACSYHILLITTPRTFSINIMLSQFLRVYHQCRLTKRVIICELFWSLLKWTMFIEAAGAGVKINLSFKTFHHMKV